MRYVVLIFMIFFASLAISQSPKNEKESWQTILEDRSSVHQIEMNSILRENQHVYYFVHRMIFKTPRAIPDGKKITSILTLNVLHCGTKRSVVISDIFYDDDVIIARNNIAQNDYPSEPGDGTPHSVIMKQLCGHPKNFI